MVKIEAIPCTAMPAAATGSSETTPSGVLRAAPGSPLASRAVVLAAVALLQVGLGIATLLTAVPLELALAHQALALALFGLATVHLRATELERAG